VLKKAPASPSIGDEDVFAYNDKFTNKQLKIKINSVQSRESVEEQKETAEKVFADRQYAVDAAIVRIMKSRKRMEHSNLMTELMGQLKFACRTADVKKRLESLIERECAAYTNCHHAQLICCLLFAGILLVMKKTGTVTYINDLPRFSSARVWKLLKRNIFCRLLSYRHINTIPFIRLLLRRVL
jgi:hypothetical protein